MSKRLFVLFATLAVSLSAGTNANSCPGILDGADRYGGAEFYSDTNFGTVGLLIGALQGRIVVPTGSCISMRRPRNVEVVFNHRNSSDSDVGFVSFKIYAVGAARSAAPVLKVVREGAWSRGSESLQSPFQPPPMQNKIDAYDQFHDAESAPTTLQEKFDMEFGKLHGQPAGSNFQSWHYLRQMQPAKLIEAEGMNFNYLYHNIQRVTVSADAKQPGITVSAKTTKTEHDALLIAVYSPLNETVHKTILLKF
jgi:hypothetical protein